MKWFDLSETNSHDREKFYQLFIFPFFLMIQNVMVSNPKSPPLQADMYCQHGRCMRDKNTATVCQPSKSLSKRNNFLKAVFFTLMFFITFIAPVSVKAADGDSCLHAVSVAVPSVTNVNLAYEWQASRWNRGRIYYYQFTAPSNGSIHIYTTGANTDTDALLQNSNCTQTLSRDDAQSDNIDIIFTANASTTYKLALYNFDRTDYGNFQLHIEYAQNTPSATNWIKSADGTSAYTDPSPYTNNVDITETLSIPAATSLEVSVSGQTENNYDFLYITDSAGTVRRFDDNINTTYTAVGPNITLRFTSDNYVTENGVQVSIAVQPVLAVDDSFTTPVNTTLTENVITNDSGSQITVTSHTNPSHGSLSITVNGVFTYTPNSGYVGVDTFTYTITDLSGSTDTATVTIDVSDATEYFGTVPFYLINPTHTRNIRGDYKIAGNTVMCVTSSSSQFDAACIDDRTKNDNGYMVKYIDIDGDTSTWNSTSSYINLPASYDQQGGQGIMWAGLFWQGNVNTDNDDNDNQRLAIANATGTYSKVEMDTGNNIDIQDYDTNNVKFKIDDGSYINVKASTHFQYNYYGDDGSTYAAYSDVTSYLQNANLATGKHVFTVANLTTNEGREANLGNFGGWTLVVIYAEDFNGQPRNVSVYNGYVRIPDSQMVPIEGFKLPSAGNISAQFSVFAGEGEYVYGTPSGRYDRMGIGDTNVVADHIGMPGATDQNNIFDAILDNILRDDVAGASNKLVNNNNGIDVDSYDVSTIMEGYRDVNPDIDTIYISLSSNQDYVTPSMMVFSTELYKPNICYDYTFDISGFVLDSVNNDVNTSYHHFYPTLTSHVSVRSLEGDFTLTNSRLTITTDPEYLNYESGTAAVAPNLIYGYSTVPVYDLNNPSPSSFTMNIGNGAGTGAGNGGSIDAFQTIYTRFNHDMNTSQGTINTVMQMRVEYEVDFGSGPVPQVQFLDANSNCGGGGAYAPTYGMFNIVGESANSDEYNLVTQVSGRPYTVRAYGYDVDNVTPKSFDTAIQVEIFNADFFENDTTLSCNNPDANVTVPSFYQFNNQSSISIPGQQFDIAQRNAGYRVWYMTKADGSLVLHHCDDTNKESCFEGLYATNFGSDPRCSTECTTGADGCYECLRKYYGKPVCSRDNFSIRPETYRVDVNDSTIDLGRNNTVTPRNVAGGYNYGVQVNATSYNTDTVAVGYVQGFGARASFDEIIDENTYYGATMINGFRTNAACNNITSEEFPFTFWQGYSINNNVVLRDVGRYKFHILDNQWTAVDQSPLAQFGTGCTVNSAVAPVTGTVGCNISTNYPSATHVAGDHTDYEFAVYPYKFDMTQVSYDTPATNDRFVYSNQLGFTPGVDYNMSVHFVGPIEAQGQDSTVMTNFVTGCYVSDLNLTFDSNSTPLAPQDVNGNALVLRWHERDATDVPTDTTQGKSERFTVDPNPRLVSLNFEKIKQGKTDLDLYINYERAGNTPHNPFSFTSRVLRTECIPLGSCDSTAAATAGYRPQGINVYNNTTTILYGRVNAPRKRVMCASSTSACTGDMTFYYEFYADSTADATSKALITSLLPNNTRQRSLDSVNWYRNAEHNVSDGVVTAATQSGLITAGAYTTSSGVTNSSYTYSGGRGFPYKDTITVTSNVGVQPWLVYDPYAANATQMSGEIEYYGPGSWTSTGDNDTHTDISSGNKKINRRIRW